MRLEINDIKADMGDQAIAITRQSINIENQTTRSIDFTNRFSLPKTENNNKIFNSAYVLNSNNKSLDVFYSAKIIDQFFLFIGKAILTDADNVYRVQLIDDSKGLFDAMKQKANKLLWDDQDIIFNITNYDLYKHSNSSIWVWPIVAMHEEKNTTKTPIPITGNADLTYSRPCFNFKEIINKAIEANGWQLSEYDNLLEKLAISANHEKFYVTAYQKTINATVSGVLDGLLTNDFSYNTTVLDSSIELTSKCTIRIRGNVSLSNQRKITIKATMQPSGQEKVKETIINSTTTEIDIAKTFTIPNADTSMVVEISTDGDIDFNKVLYYTNIEEQDLGAISANNLLNYKIKVYDNLPNITQIDLFTVFLLLTNSIIEPDSFRKEVKLKSLKKINNLNSIDWSEKLDRGSESISNKISQLTKKNDLIYENDDTIDSEVGSSFFAVENETLKAESTYIKIPFSASEDVLVNNNTIASWDIYSDTERVNELTERLIQLNSTGTYYLSEFASISMENIKDTYYSQWFESFKRLRIVEAYFNLKKLDVLGFDFTKLVYIEYFKSYFYVLKIGDFMPNKRTKVKLLKIA